MMGAEELRHLLARHGLTVEDLAARLMENRPGGFSPTRLRLMAEGKIRVPILLAAEIRRALRAKPT